MAFNRIKYREDYTIEHRHWLYGKRGRDNTAQRMTIADTQPDASGNPISVSDKLWHDLVHERIEDVKKLAAHINQKPNWSVVDTGDIDIDKL